MHTITIWSQASTNFDANAFVRSHGTETLQILSRQNAFMHVASLINDPCIIKVILKSDEGTLTWAKNPEHESCHFESDLYDDEMNEFDFDDLTDSQD